MENSLKIGFLYPDERIVTDSKKKLFHSSGDGYVVFKKFISQDEVEHMRNFWIEEASFEKRFENFPQPRYIYNQGPNYKYEYQFGKTYHLFFWNLPNDEFTYSLAFQIQLLRNILCGKEIYRDFFPFASRGRSASPRIVQTKNGVGDIVKKHSDWDVAPNLDPSALQATLILSKKNKDYYGDGFYMYNNQGEKKIVDDKNGIEVDVGDLIIWKYQNPHGVENVRSDESQIGFLRMILPPEIVNKKPHMVNTIKNNNKITLRQRAIRKLKNLLE